MPLLLAAALAGTLCIEGDCRPLERMPSRVTPAAEARAFVWSDGKRVVAGVIEAHARRLPQDGVSHAVEVRLSDAARVPVTVALMAPERTWTFVLPAAGAFTLVHPRCACTLRASADEHRAAEGALGERTTLLLRRLPLIRGVVVDADGATPLARADVSVPETNVRATTGENGAFRIAVDGDWPEAIEVVHPARAAKLVVLPKVIADVELPAIRLSAGGTLRLHVAPPIGGGEALSWQLRDGDRTLRSGAFDSGSASAAIEALAPGDYRVVVGGTAPLQRFVTNVRIADAQVTDAYAEIRPLLIEGAVTFGGTPLGNAELEVRPRNGAWVAKVKAGDDGRFAEELWQGGDYAIAVVRKPLVWTTRRTLSGEGRVEVALEVPNRIVRGRVVDAATGAPVEEATVTLRARAGHDAIVLKARSAADGSYELTAVENGPATLDVLKEGYRFARPVTFILGEDEPLHEEVLIVERLPVARSVVVTDSRGLAVAGAAVLVPNRAWDDLAHAADTDAAGRTTVHLRSTRERGTLFVVPRSGSIGFARLAGEGELAVRIDDRASVTMQVESTTGEPLPRVMVMMSIDGVPVPPPVLEEMARLQGVPLFTDARGRLVHARMPAGHYDFEPIAGRGKVGAAVNVAILPGAQTVVMKLEK